MREIILIRTHKYSDAIGEHYDQLAATSGRDVMFICDETHGSVDVGPGRAKASITQEYVRSMNLHVPGRFGWLCGDYFLYAALKIMPRFDRYWMIESDVRFNFSKTTDFFDEFKNNKADALAFHIYKSPGSWYWHYPMAHFTDSVYACLFPVVSVSRNALEFAYNERVRMSEVFDEIVPKTDRRRWPNDESFLMSILMNNGMKICDLNFEKQKFTTQSTFTVGLPQSHSRLIAKEPDNRIYHPVHSKEAFVAKANTWLNSYISRKTGLEKMVQVFGSDFMTDMASEASPKEMDDFMIKFTNYINNF